jgi:cathepsin F
MRTAAVLLVVLSALMVVSANLISERQQFNQWKAKHGKSYEHTQAEAHAFDNFRATLKRLAARNNHRSQRAGGAVFGLNGLSDLSPAEFRARYLSGYTPAGIDASRPVLYDETQDNTAPTSFDWRSYESKSVTPVKDQGNCGSCWAFSATEGLESQWYLTNKEQLILAPQQTVDCDKVDEGCNGGDLPTAFTYMKENGVELESAYPYTSGSSGNAGTCKFKKSSVKAHVTGYSYAVAPCNDSCTEQSKLESALKVAVAAGTDGVHGPPSICVDASNWQDYSSGIYSYSDCSSEFSSLDHCIQLVGYTEKYWIVRNSWADSWGVAGYIYLEAGHNTCGVADEVVFPHAKEATTKHHQQH